MRRRASGLPARLVAQPQGFPLHGLSTTHNKRLRAMWLTSCAKQEPLPIIRRLPAIRSFITAKAQRMFPQGTLAKPFGAGNIRCSVSWIPLKISAPYLYQRLGFLLRHNKPCGTGRNLYAVKCPTVFFTATGLHSRKFFF